MSTYLDESCLHALRLEVVYVTESKGLCSEPALLLMALTSTSAQAKIFRENLSSSPSSSEPASGRDIQAWLACMALAPPQGLILGERLWTEEQANTATYAQQHA